MRSLMISLGALAALATSVPATAGDRDDRRDRARDSRYVDARELRAGQYRVAAERRDLQQAYRYGDRRDIKEQRRDLQRAQRELRRDSRDWQRGQRYSYGRPDPRYNGYFADNYYRRGAYQPVRLGNDDRIYRGRDNRYYCRRNDGTTGLIIGALGGGVLGNVIAPGGSKTLGSVLGGGLGAVLGNSIGRGNVTCQ